MFAFPMVVPFRKLKCLAMPTEKESSIGLGNATLFMTAAILTSTIMLAVILLSLVYGAITFHRTTFRRLPGRRRETLVAGGCG